MKNNKDKNKKWYLIDIGKKIRKSIVKYFFIENQKVVLFLKFRKNDWEEASASALTKPILFLETPNI